MGKKGLGPMTVRMYEDIVRTLFHDIENVVDDKAHAMKTAVRIQAAKELGVFDKLQLEASLKYQLEQVTKELRDIRENKRNPQTGEWESVLERKVQELMREAFPLSKDIEKMKSDILYDIRLSLLPEEAVTSINRLKERLAEMKVLVEATPVPAITDGANIDIDG